MSLLVLVDSLEANLNQNRFWNNQNKPPPSQNDKKNTAKNRTGSEILPPEVSGSWFLVRGRLASLPKQEQPTKTGGDKSAEILPGVLVLGSWFLGCLSGEIGTLPRINRLEMPENPCFSQP